MDYNVIYINCSEVLQNSYLDSESKSSEEEILCLQSCIWSSFLLFICSCILAEIIVYNNLCFRKYDRVLSMRRDAIMAGF